MDNKEVYRILQNNKNVPFVKKIIKKLFSGTLHVSEYNTKFIVHASSLEKAIKKNDYIEFDKNNEAQDLANSYKSFWDDPKPEDMNQDQFETWRSKKYAKYRYSGSINPDTLQYSGTIERAV